MTIMKAKKIVLVVTDGNDYSMKEVSEWLYFYCKMYAFELAVFWN
jgi:hypothetical protein